MSYRRPTVYKNGKQWLVSRLTVSEHLGRPLLTSEIVHHRDGDPFNNAIGNLQLVTRAEHKKIHAEIGVTTRLKKVWKLDPDIIAKRFRRETSEQIAKDIGCSGRTILRAVKQTPIYAKTDIRTIKKTLDRKAGRRPD